MSIALQKVNEEKKKKHDAESKPVQSFNPIINKMNLLV